MILDTRKAPEVPKGHLKPMDKDKLECILGFLLHELTDMSSD